MSAVARGAALSFLVLVAPPAAAAAAAQPTRPEGAAPARAEVEMSGFVGVLAPLARLVNDVAEGTSAEVSTTPGFGATLGFFLPGGLGIGVWGLWVPAEVAVTRLDPDTDLPTTVSDDADWLAGAAGLVYRPRLSGSRAPLRPFVSVGAGVRRLSLDSGDETVVNDATDFIGTAAAGVEVDITSALALRFEVRDAISEYESEARGESIIQNDLAISIGLAGRL